MKKKPMRRCIVCRKRDAKEILLRFVLVGNDLVWDRQHKCEGRGAYLHSLAGCCSRSSSLKLWQRAFRVSSFKSKHGFSKCGNDKVSDYKVNDDEVSGGLDQGSIDSVLGQVMHEVFGRIAAVEERDGERGLGKGLAAKTPRRIKMI